MPLLIRGFGVREYGLYILAGSGCYALVLDLGVGTSGEDGRRGVGDG